MQQLDNVHVFAASIAQIMDQLDRSFPLLCQISTTQLHELYGPSTEDTEPRIIHPGEQDYETLLPYGFLEDTDLSYVCNEVYSEDFNARPDWPLAYWTPAQRSALVEGRIRVRKAEEIFDAILKFLLREGYVT